MAVSIHSALTTLTLLLLSLNSAAFVGQHSFTLAHHRHQANQIQKTTSSSDITSLLEAKNSKNNNNNNNVDLGSESKRTYTKIDDGSPLGVAIVGIGGLLYTKGGDTFSFLQQQDSNAVWIILATASTAAGLSRLIRYINDKQSNNGEQ